MPTVAISSFELKTAWTSQAASEYKIKPLAVGDDESVYG